MFQTTVLEILPEFPEDIRKEMREIIGKQDYEPVWQTTEWQLMIRETGYTRKSFFVWVTRGKKLIAYAILEKRSVGMGLFGLFSVGGPVFPGSSLMQENNIPPSLLISTLSQKIQQLAQREQVIFVNLEPIQEIPLLPSFSRGFYKNFIEKYTALVDLTKTEEEILSNMKQKGRYNIRVAEKAGVRVERVTFTEENLDIFYSLFSETLDRDKFSGNSREYFRCLLEYLENGDLGGLFFAKRENEVVAAGIFVFSGKTALYYYGASSSDNNKRKYMATYLLQWEAIREAKKRGCTTYDFLWISNPEDKKSHLVGVTDFKMKLTDQVWKLPESQIFVAKKTPYLTLRARRFLKKLIWR